MLDKKWCTKCKEVRDKSQFSVDLKKCDGLRSSCKICQKQYNDSRSLERKEWRDANKDIMREINYKKKYNMTIADYDRLLKEQDCKCAICGSIKSKTNKTSYFSIDHCHKTGKVRGLLCDRCNVGIGSLEDSIEILSKAIEYLKKNEAINE